MNHIRAVGFLDLSVFTATFVRQYREKLKDDSNYQGMQTLLLRSATSDGSVLKEWKSAANVLRRIKSEAAPFVGGKPAVLGKALIASLKPGAFTNWQVHDDEYTKAHFRLHVCMIPSPYAYLCSGGEFVCPAVGHVTYFNTQVLHSEFNLGACPRVHLVVDVRRPEEV